jgi:ligand-binding sensor domain-containing protein
MHIKQIYCVKLLLFIAPLFAWSVGTAGVVSSSDDYEAQVWDTDSGLPHSTVTGVVQTPDGYIWIGTLRGGLARFDGSHFVNFHPGNTPELSSIEIFKLLVDGNGTLWIGSIDGSVDSYRNGKFRFEFQDAHTPESWLSEVVSSPGNPIILSSLSGWLFSRTHINGTNEWKTFPTPDFGGAQMPDFGRDPCEDSDGVVWYRMAGGHLARIIGEKIIRPDHPPGLRSPNVNSLRKDDSGRLWVGTDQEIAVWDGNSFVDMTPTNGEPNLAVRDLAFCPDGSLWVRTDDKLRKCINRRWLTEAEPWDGQFPPSIRALRMFGDSRGGVWVIHYGQGLWHIDSQGHVSRVGEQQGLPNGFVESWCEDREGNFWAGLRDGGLACIRPRIFHGVWPPEGWKNKSMRSICEDADGAMWFGVAGPTVLRWFEGAFAGLTPPAEPNPGTETAVLPDGPGRLWVGTVRNGLWLLENGVFKRPFPSGDINTVVRCLCRDRTGALWIGSEFGLSRWDQGVLKHFTLADGFSAASCVLCIAEDPAGDIWIGTQSGELRRWHLGEFKSFYPPDSSAGEKKSADAPLHENSGREWFWAFHFDDDGVLWIGSLGGGLLRFKDGHFTRFTTHDGLPNEHVSQILEDDLGQLWLGTRAGISRVKKRELTNFSNGGNEPINFITYGRSDGLPTIECSGGIQPACWKGRDGRLWFSTVKGPVWVNPSALRFNRLPPPVQLEEIMVDGERATMDSVSPAQPGGRVLDPMRIAAGRHHFEFKFSALSFTSPDKVKFRWRLKGLEADWVDGGDRHAASYGFLPPGDYQFEVRACNNDGVWNETGVAARLTVLPYFWQTWWFKIAAILLLIAVLLTIYFIRIARWRTLENLRLRIARDLHDEVGANLGSISLLAQMMEHTPTRTDATQVRGLAVQTMDTLRDIVWFIDPTHDRLSDLVVRMHETARTMLPTVEFKFNQTGDFDSTDLSLAFRRNVLPLFKETLHNLLKHSRATQVEISVCRNDKEFQFRVHDNGTGFDPKQKYGGNGLKNMKRRAAEIGGCIEFDSHSGGGTTVTLTAPITQTRTWL